MVLRFPRQHLPFGFPLARHRPAHLHGCALCFVLCAMRQVLLRRLARRDISQRNALTRNDQLLRCGVSPKDLCAFESASSTNASCRGINTRGQRITATPFVSISIVCFSLALRSETSSTSRVCQPRKPVGLVKRNLILFPRV